MMDFDSPFIECIARTELAKSYRFGRPADFEYEAGQYIIVTLGEGDELKHPLSLSSSPTEEGFIEFTKRMTGSPFCGRLDELKPGDIVHFRGPAGTFGKGKIDGQIVFLTGGIGITPIRSMLRDLADRGEDRDILLIYGNRDEDDVAFLEEFDELQVPSFSMVHVFVEPKGRIGAHKGFISGEIIAKEVEDPAAATYLISGPPGMVNAMVKNLEGLGVPPERMLTDKFLGYE